MASANAAAANPQQPFTLTYCGTRVRFDPRVRGRGYQINVWQGRAYDEQLICLFKTAVEALPADAAVLDVGANVGLFSLAVTTHAVHAFEPVAATYDILQANLALNPAARARARAWRLGLTDAKGAGTLAIHKPADGDMMGMVTFGSRPNYAAATEEVPVDTVDAFCAAHGVAKVGLIKVDTEGWELHVLEGARGVIARDRPRLLLEHNAENTKQAGLSLANVLAFLTSVQYLMKHVGLEDIMCVPEEALPLPPPPVS